ncbi:hypothetical protein NDI39_12750 [Microcoleus sp. ZQ-A2]|nr:hypothetical protein [Microcoleus sp. FACHB-1]
MHQASTLDRARSRGRNFPEIIPKNISNPSPKDLTTRRSEHLLRQQPPLRGVLTSSDELRSPPHSNSSLPLTLFFRTLFTRDKS